MDANLLIELHEVSGSSLRWRGRKLVPLSLWVGCMLQHTIIVSSVASNRLRHNIIASNPIGFSPNTN